MACASFSTLPLELKTRIVEMTSEQEDAFKERVRGSDERAGHINGLSSLALVNKELRTLAAKHQFKTLSTVRGQASRPLFRFTILPRHGHHITEVVLAGSKERQLDDVLAILSHLPALHTLALSHAAAVALFGPAVALLPNPSGESDAAACRADMLEHISSKITSLTLSKFSPLTSPALRRVQFGESVVKHPITKLPPSKDLAVPSSLAAYANLVHSRGLDPSVLDRPHLTPFHPEAQLDYTENEGKYLAGTLRRTLEFGLIELDRMAAEGRAANAVEWVPILKPLEDKRLAWKD
ncbi:hypothetical protein RQP46_002496 [Phenoliferia psychrophenolica]